jgi:hypothetical protein
MKILSVAVLMVVCCGSAHATPAPTICSFAIAARVPCVLGVTDNYHWRSQALIPAPLPGGMPSQGTSFATVEAQFTTVINWEWSTQSAAIINGQMDLISDLDLARFSHFYSIEDKGIWRVGYLYMYAAQKLSAVNLVRFASAFGMSPGLDPHRFVGHLVRGRPVARRLAELEVNAQADLRGGEARESEDEGACARHQARVLRVVGRGRRPVLRSMSEVYTFGVDLVYGGRKEAVWREDYDKVAAELAKVHEQYASYREAAGAALGAMAQLDERIKDLEGVVERKSALIHALAEKLAKRNGAAS